MATQLDEGFVPTWNEGFMAAGSFDEEAFARASTPDEPSTLPNMATDPVYLPPLSVCSLTVILSAGPLTIHCQHHPSNHTRDYTR